MKNLITLILVALLVYLPLSISAKNGGNKSTVANGPTFSGGSGTEADPFLISTKEDVVTLAVAVGQDNNYAGVYFKMTNDIDLAIEKKSEEANNFLPIGNNIDGSLHPFSGVFDGDNHKILNLNADWRNIGFVGLFGVAQNATIKNLTVSNSEIYGDLSVAAILGAGVMDCVIENCHTTADVKVSCRKFYVAGICGGLLIGGAKGSSIIDCTNSAEVNGCVGYTAGILATNGQNNTKVKRCGNFGRITDDNLHVAGVVAHSKNGIFIEDCFNSGQISLLSLEGAENALAAGILASGTEVPAEEMIVIERCYNVGAFNNEVDEGGYSKTHAIFNADLCENYNVEMENVFYCENRYLLEYKGAEPMAEADMRSAVFVSMLNGGSAEHCWRIVDGFNEGFPVSAPVIEGASSIAVVETMQGAVRAVGGVLKVIDAPAKVPVTLYDATGRTVLETVTDVEGNAEVNMVGIPTGVYLVKVANRGYKIIR